MFPFIWGGLGFALALLVQRLVLHSMEPRRLVGDEGEYVKKGRLRTPFDPHPFIRVPFLATLSGFAHRVHSHPVVLLRQLMALAGVLGAMLTATTAWQLAGWPAACLAGATVLLLPERLILSCHIWPDGLLLLWIAVLTLLLGLPAPLPPWWLATGLGTVCCLAFLTRFDGLILVPTLILAWVQRYGFSDLIGPLMIGLPTLLTFVGLSLFNGRRNGIYLPDTTMFFNFMLLGREAKSDSFGKHGLDRFISATKGDWDKLAPQGRRRDAFRSIISLLLRPWHTILGVLDRFLAFLGPDTFVREKLFSIKKGGYPELSNTAKRAWSIALFLCFPLLTALTILLWFGTGTVPDYLWPSLAMALAGFLVHTRTRYRLSMLPGLALALAQGVFARTWQIDWPWPVWLCLCLAIPALLLFFPRRRELSQQT